MKSSTELAQGGSRTSPTTCFLPCSRPEYDIRLSFILDGDTNKSSFILVVTLKESCFALAKGSTTRHSLRGKLNEKPGFNLILNLIFLCFVNVIKFIHLSFLQELEHNFALFMSLHFSPNPLPPPTPQKKVFFRTQCRGVNSNQTYVRWKNMRERERLIHKISPK